MSIDPVASNPYSPKNMAAYLAKQCLRGSITIHGKQQLGEGKGAEYNRLVLGVLSTIECSQVGRLLIRSINQYPSEAVTIAPYSGKYYAQYGRLNALAFADQPETAGDNGKDGRGSTCTVRFSPDDWLTSGVANQGGRVVAVGNRRDEVLHHELAHALSNLAGKRNSSIAPAGFDTKNEF